MLELEVLQPIFHLRALRDDMRESVSKITRTLVEVNAQGMQAATVA